MNEKPEVEYPAGEVGEKRLIEFGKIRREQRNKKYVVEGVPAKIIRTDKNHKLKKNSYSMSHKG